jgi:hypothetical protein
MHQLTLMCGYSTARLLLIFKALFRSILALPTARLVFLCLFASLGASAHRVLSAIHLVQLWVFHHDWLSVFH